MFEFLRQGGAEDGCVSIQRWFNLKEIPSPLRYHFRAAWAWVDNIHGVTSPEGLVFWIDEPQGERHHELMEGCVLVVQDDQMLDMGTYEPSRRVPGEPFNGPCMTINGRVGDKAGTIVHEILHLIERELFHSSRGLTAGQAKRRYAALSYLRGTESFRECLKREVRTRAVWNLLASRPGLTDEEKAEISKLDAARRYLEYASDEEEWFARAYSQMVQKRAAEWGNNPFPHPGRRVEPAEKDLPMYLTEKELGKFDKRMHRLFREMGWYKVRDNG